MNWVYLSYYLSADTPSYGNEGAIEVESTRSITAGDSCNTSIWHIPNHLGTHIDFPKHFVEEGKSVDDYPASFWRFERVYLINLDKTEPRMIIGPEVISKNMIPQDTELLLINTGFSSLRHLQEYWQKNPVFTPDLAEYLRGICPEIRVMGFDSISLSSFTDRPLGRMAHKAFLDNPKPILPLEDMDLSPLRKGIKINSVCVAPLRVSNTDSSLCTVLAEIDN